MGVANLNKRFAIAGTVEFKTIGDNSPVVEVKNAQATASIALQGAQVYHWAPNGEQPVIWLSKAAKFSPGKSLRGGAPICWPWFGAHATQASFPGHGYARTVPWEVIKTESLRDGRTLVAFRLVESDGTRSYWPFNTPVECHVTVGKTLEIELITRNNGKTEISLTEALHTYFNVGDITKVAIHGLDKTEYLDKVENFAKKTQAGPITLASEVDRVYINSSTDCVIDDAALSRKIRIQKRNAQSTIVWNPWTEKSDKMGDMGPAGYRSMLCVESGNAAVNAVRVPPGGEQRLWVSYSVEH